MRAAAGQASGAPGPAQVQAISSRTPTSSCSYTGTSTTDRESERPGEADLISPSIATATTGDVTLTFQKEYPKFMNYAASQSYAERERAGGSASGAGSQALPVQASATAAASSSTSQSNTASDCRCQHRVDESESGAPGGEGTAPLHGPHLRAAGGGRHARRLPRPDRGGAGNRHRSPRTSTWASRSWATSAPARQSSPMIVSKAALEASRTVAIY